MSLLNTKPKPLLVTLAFMVLFTGCQPKLLREIIPQIAATSASSSPSILAGVTVTVEPRFANAANWNDYIRRCVAGDNTCAGIEDGVTACDATETGGATACIHGGTRKKVTLSLTSCSGLSMTDALGAFDWSCEVVGGFATFYSKLKDNKGLFDLVTWGDPYGTWNSNSVTLTAGSESVTSTTTAWWTNTIRALPDNSVACAADAEATPAWTCMGGTEVAVLNLASTVYIYQADRATRGYNINADKIAITNVTNSNASILGDPTGGSGCNAINFRTAGADTTCTLSLSTSRNFLWVEGNYGVSDVAGNPVAYVFGMGGNIFSYIRRATFGYGTNASVKVGAFNYFNRFNQIRAYGSADKSLDITPTTALNLGENRGNIFWDISASNSSTDNIFLFKDNDYNVFSNVVVHNSSGKGFGVRADAFDGDGGTAMNVFSRITAAHNQYAGFELWTDGGALEDSIVHNIAIVGNGNQEAAFYLLGTAASDVTRPTVSQYAASRNVNLTGTTVLDYVTDGKFTGNFLYGISVTAHCAVSNATNPGLDNACAPVDDSDHNAVGGRDASGSFVLDNTGDDTTNNSDSIDGEADGNTIATADLFSFDNFFRSWGLDFGGVWPGVGYSGYCDITLANTCQIYDFSLTTVSDLLNTTGDGSSANEAFSANCPAEAAGTEFVTSQEYTYNADYFSGLNGIETVGDADTLCEAGETCVQRYLKAAVELFDDLSGDDDGLCESGEACLYTPNFGAYQGHGTLSECAFTDGTVTGVTMYGYGTNGY